MPPPRAAPQAVEDSGQRGPVPVREALGNVPGQAQPAEASAAAAAEPRPERGFEMDGERWIARVAGRGAGGTGRVASAYIVAVHFSREEEPERPLREALLPSGRFEGLFDAELVGLYQESVEIVVPGDG